MTKKDRHFCLHQRYILCGALKKYIFSAKEYALINADGNIAVSLPV
jgi:hypothetical protein